MKTNCQIGDDGKCTQCGRPASSGAICPKGPYGKHARREPRPEAPKCQHLGDPTGEYVNARNCGGCGQGQSAIYHCGLYQLSAPHIRLKRIEVVGRKDITLCRDCEHDPRNQLSGMQPAH